MKKITLSLLITAFSLSSIFSQGITGFKRIKADSIKTQTGSSYLMLTQDSVTKEFFRQPIPTGGEGGEPKVWLVYETIGLSSEFSEGTTPVIKKTYSVNSEGMPRWITVKITGVTASQETFVMERKVSFFTHSGTCNILSNTVTVPKTATGNLENADFDIVINGTNPALQMKGIGITFTWKATVLIE